MFELGYYNFWLQNQISILHLAFCVDVQPNYLACITRYCTEVVDCFTVFPLGRTKIQHRCEPQHKNQKPIRNCCSWGFAVATHKHRVGHKYTHEIA